MKIIYINDIIKLKLLPFKDKRSVERYCAIHNIALLGSDKKYVLTLQFLRACLESQISDLKKVYGNKFPEILQYEMKLYHACKSALETVRLEKNNSSVPVKPSPTIKSETEKQFLLDIQNALELTSPK